ncbi:hypothetical protein ZWY2020_025766 [Hordeum vulgare]|nr:hypothetical protein ZWY2020_025766 [Hordeum vulgare]
MCVPEPRDPAASRSRRRPVQRPRAAWSCSRSDPPDRSDAWGGRQLRHQEQTSADPRPSSVVFAPQRQHDPSPVAGVPFLSLLLPLYLSFSLFLSLFSLVDQETDPWRGQCSPVLGASPSWEEVAASPPTRNTIHAIPNQQVPSATLLPGLPRPPLNPMAAEL